MAIKSEDRLQQECVMWYRNNYIELKGTLYSVPNGGKRNPREAKLLKSTGLYKGVADLHLLLKGGTIIFLEAKTIRGTQKREQKEWEETVTELGFTYVIFRTLEQFKTIVYKYVGSPVPNHLKYTHDGKLAR